MGRQRCIGCARPVSVCLCSQLPSPPLQTRTCVIVLQHPHEARHKLSTLPILAKCLANCHVLQGRRFQAGSSPLLDFFFTHNPPAHHALLLFPTVSAQPISAWFAHHQLQDSCSCRASIQVGSSYSVPRLLKEGKPTLEDLETSSSACQTVEMGAPESNTENSEASHSDLLIKPMGGTSTCGACDSFSHFQQDAGEGNYVAQALDSKFQQVSTSADVAPCDSEGHAINKLYDSTFPSQQGGTSICLVKDTNSCPDNLGFPDLVLIAVDATWQHANEMIRASAPYLNKFAIPVCLPFDADQEGVGMANSELIIRKEPFKGCMTTLGAISSCLKVLEPNGVEIHDKLTCVLRSMVHFQALNIASHKVRMHQQKKSAFYSLSLHEKSHCSEACRSLK